MAVEMPPVGPEDPADALVAAVSQANIPTLLMMLTQMTGDTGWLEKPFCPSRGRGLGVNDDGGLPPEVQEQVREASVRAIRAWMDGVPVAIPRPDPELLTEMLSTSMAEHVPADYADMVAHELKLEDPSISVAAPLSPAVPAHGQAEEFRAVIIGAGASGLCAAVNLQRAGIPYTILERNDEVGGVWFENQYPGAAVDTPSHLYTFSFAKNDWSRFFASQGEIKRYLNRIADEYGVREHIRFGVSADSASYDEEQQLWTVAGKTADSGEATWTGNLLFSAVGAFNKPKWPAVPGLREFEGPVVHTARWQPDLNLTGKRVAVIGSGASSMQVVPAIADEVDSMVVFQRSPQWAAPFEQFKQEVPDGVRWLFANVPIYADWYRVRLAWIFNDRVYDALQRDPEWPHPERSINAINDGHREFFTKYIVSELGDRQDLLESCLPTYPPFGKRMLLDNGWFRTITREDVDLVTSGVRKVEGRTLTDSDGQQHEVDAIVVATGFDVVNFVAPLRVFGRGGAELADVWEGDNAKAYLGTTVPGFPNFFCLYGPNLQFGHGGSLIFMLELQLHYVMDLLTQMAASGHMVAEPRREIFDDYNEQVDAAHDRMVWTHPGMDVYYRNSRGRVVVNNPFRIVDYWHRVRNADLAEYLVESPRATSAVG